MFQIELYPTSASILPGNAAGSNVFICMSQIFVDSVAVSNLKNKTRILWMVPWLREMIPALAAIHWTLGRDRFALLFTSNGCRFDSDTTCVSLLELRVYSGEHVEPKAEGAHMLGSTVSGDKKNDIDLT